MSVCLSAAAALRAHSVLKPCALRLETLLPARATRRAYVDAPVHAPVVKVLPLVRQVSIALRSSQTHTPAGFRCALLLARRPGQLQVEAATGRRPPLVGEGSTPTFLVCGRRQNRSLMRPQNTTMDNLQHSSPPCLSVCLLACQWGNSDGADGWRVLLLACLEPASLCLPHQVTHAQVHIALIHHGALNSSKCSPIVVCWTLLRCWGHYSKPGQPQHHSLTGHTHASHKPYVCVGLLAAGARLAGQCNFGGADSQPAIQQQPCSNNGRL